MTQWLEFIRPHLHRYALSGRGEKKTFIQALAKDTNKSVNTLRRFISAAQFLESDSITQVAPGVAHMPLNAVEFIMRTRKRNPTRAKQLLDQLRKGTVSVRQLKSEFDKISDLPAPAEATADRIDATRLRTIIAKLAARPGKPVSASAVVLTQFKAWDTPPPMFDRVAYPVFMAALPEERKVVIFDEGVLAWPVSPDRVKREFLRNIAVAATLYDLVLVICSSMESDVHRLRSKMRTECRRRISVRTGI